ncbi:FAD-binding oxidoreductase [Veronia nyctiphanis]|uniref:FAD-binding oxidoreductase n=1 Tax=Veronia nyctiphanis TaxID=1278244 RepID=A0A4Q0YVT1_9GAMM|nr:FAD-linked oxidase C-terminal domain-containing protein [Veronia nyctiphanis]RXJ73279.1 FAD-binding oxidoreductase [Veronia nyctiphanis]
MVTRKELAALLTVVVGAEHVIEDDESKKPFECDGISVYQVMPMLVVLPANSEQVAAVLRVCHQHKIPVVPRGAGTGLSAGALPHREGVLLSLSRLDRIISIEPDRAVAVVQPGVRNIAISDAAKPYGLFYGPDPSSQIACSIGGNVAENAGGVHCLKYGLTIHNVVALEMIDITGERFKLGGGSLDQPGFDLLAILTGSEGMLGVVTEVTVQLLPIPDVAQVLLAGFDSLTYAADAVGAIIGHGIIPGGLEMMDRYAIQAAEDFAKAGYPKDAEALLLCELDGNAAEVNDQIDRVSTILSEHHASSIRVSADEQERALMWKGRKSAFPAVGRLSPDYYCMDGTIPRRHLAHVLTEIHRMSDQFGLRVANVFHAGDGNLHPLILFDANQSGELEKAEKFGADILALCVKVGGCITGEHGVGSEKINQMREQFTDLELSQFHRLKEAFDVDGTLNPGKGIPEPKHCQEYRTLTNFDASTFLSSTANRPEMGGENDR